MSSKQKKSKRTERPNQEAKSTASRQAPEKSFDEFMKLWEEMERKGGPEVEALSLLDQAQLCDDPEDKKRLAQDALKLDPGSLGAYMTLAKSCETAEEALPYCERAVEIGEKDLREAGISLEEDGVLGGRLETLLYLNARKLLADCLAELDRGAEAFAHYSELLRLDDEDTVMARYPIAVAILAEGKHEMFQELLKRFEGDRSASWLFTRALLEFRSNGDSRSAVKTLDRAKSRNRHIQELLADPDADLPDGWENDPEGDKYVEAAMYAGDFTKTWVNTPGALEWLRKH